MPENETNYLLKELSDLLLSFLDSPLFLLGNNIKHLIIRIQKPDISNVEESYIDLSTEKEVDKMLNEFLIAYLQFLWDLLDRFNLTYESLKLNDLEEVIKTRITSIKIQKKEYLERLSVYKPILNPKTPTTHNSDDRGIIPSIITEKSTKVTRTDHTTTNDFSYNTNITTQYSTEQKFTTFDDLETTKSIVFSDNFESALNINSSEKYNFTDRYKNVCGATSDNWIIFVSILVTLFLIVSLVIFLTVFIFKRYRLKKQNFKMAESIQLEAEPYHSVPIYNN
ncbi:hypothetical protein NBO_1341g0003 [Nosema bombycis CQ1]|uniref:Uncharacterized protein n=1 Tax=Nosema bombycis (strain CQ1 / CVCC 102059) TaxID=578461 RepID=R0MEQ5_NOSB1|nr:hypothetical protein NBO_1341g0003 [Nosema bombycis CQ1]|eukprot:EOB11258.1 hypothetical protein NBO_1341g0003 [Nosema bombycis CQ1]